LVGGIAGTQSLRITAPITANAARKTGRLTAAVVGNGAVESFLWTSRSPSGAIDVEQVEPVDLRSDDLLEDVSPVIVLMH